MATTTAVALSPVTALADTTHQSLAAHIHPDVRIVRGEIDRDANAFWDWKEASDKLTSLYEFSGKYYRTHVKDSDAFSDANGFQDAVGKAEQLIDAIPPREVSDCVRAWLDASKESNRLAEKGIAKKRFRIPQELLVDWIENPNAIDSTFVSEECCTVENR